MIIVLLGPPGSGKGTQADRISKKYGIPHLSSGVLFRKEIDSKSSVGLEISKYLDNGKLVPDEITIDQVHRNLNQINLSRGVVLDGYPRTLTQAEALNLYLGKHMYKLSVSLYLSVPYEQLFMRLKERGRQDDIKDVIDKRLNDYEKEIKPLLSIYKKAEVLEVIDGNKDITEVFEQIDNVLLSGAG